MIPSTCARPHFRLSPTGETQTRGPFLHLGHATQKSHAPKPSHLQQPMQKIRPRIDTQPHGTRPLPTGGAHPPAPPAARGRGCSSSTGGGFLSPSGQLWADSVDWAWRRPFHDGFDLDVRADGPHSDGVDPSTIPTSVFIVFHHCKFYRRYRIGIIESSSSSSLSFFHYVLLTRQRRRYGKM